MDGENTVCHLVIWNVFVMAAAIAAIVDLEAEWEAKWRLGP